jgi:hypothetical protein
MIIYDKGYHWEKGFDDAGDIDEMNQMIGVV